MKRTSTASTSSTDPWPRCVADSHDTTTATHRRRHRHHLQPHIVTLMADDLGFGDTSYSGSSVVRTPHLDALAAEAVHLTHFRAPVWCAPSRASFLTGRHGWELGLAAAHGWTVLGTDSVLLSEVLRGLGYHTAVVGKFHSNPRTCKAPYHGTGGPFGCGFDQQYGFVGGMSSYYPPHHKSWSRDGVRMREQGYATDLFAAEAERIVRTHAAKRLGGGSGGSDGGSDGDDGGSPSSSGRRRAARRTPLFLWVSLNAPHTPMQAPADALAQLPPSARGWPEQTRAYAAMVERMDAAFGRVVGALRATGMLRESLVAFLSDNGGPMIPPVCNGGLRGGKGTPYEGGVRAPAFVYWPACLGRGGAARRRASAAPAHMVDWLVTFALAAAAPTSASTSVPTSASAHSDDDGKSSDGGGGGEATTSTTDARARRALLARLQRKAPHSTSLWPALSGGGGGGGGGGGARLPASAALGSRRQLVLQVGASASGVLRGRWKLLVASPRCLAVPDALPHNSTLRGFRADRFLMWNVHGRNHSARCHSVCRVAAANAASAAHHRNAEEKVAIVHNGSNAARLQAARAAGVELQLYDVHADPREEHDLLAAAAPRGDGDEARRRTELVGALLGHYLSAVRVARRAVERAAEQRRIERLPRGYEMTVWFCRQVGVAWDERRWRGAAAGMCAARSDAERSILTNVQVAAPARVGAGGKRLQGHGLGTGVGRR